MHINKILKKQKGAIILMFLVFLPFMLAFVGLAIDLGYVYTEKTKLQNAADAAVLAGVVHLRDISPPVKEYVKKMLEGNNFATTNNMADKELSENANWKISYEKEPEGDNPPQEVTETVDASRLRVRLMKKISLVFLPIIVPNFNSINIETTSVARGTANAQYDDEFQFVALDTLTMGNKVHVPSFPSTLPYAQPPKIKLKDEIESRFGYIYNDYDKDLSKNIYANNLVFGTGGTLRISGKLYSSSIDKTHLDKEIYMSDNNNYQKASNTITDSAKEFTRSIRDNGKKRLREATNENAIIINVDSYPNLLTGLGDYGFKPILSKYPLVATEVTFFNGLDILVPVIFTSETNKKFTIKRFDVSYYSFTKGIIVSGGNIELAGSSTPNLAPDGIGESERTKRLFGDIYCFSDKETKPPINLLTAIDSSAGVFSTITGGIAPTEFDGTVYADTKIIINPPNSYRRHNFSHAFASAGNIDFPADGSRDSANIFVSTPRSKKISLVE